MIALIEVVSWGTSEANGLNHNLHEVCNPKGCIAVDRAADKARKAAAGSISGRMSWLRGVRMER